MSDKGCICQGTWRAIVRDSEPRIGRIFSDREGALWSFFGVVHAEDDYYYGMWDCTNHNLVLLTCCGTIEAAGFTEVQRVTEMA